MDIAFPARALDYMPAWEDIPQELKGGDTKWNRFFTNWFYNGNRVQNLEFDLQDGIDGHAAMRQLSVICGSFAPKHEHKAAAFAYLCSLWFKDVRYSIKEKSEEKTEKTT